MIVSYPTVFLVNNHLCEISYESREHYYGHVDGEQVVSGSSVGHVRDELINDVKWRVEGDMGQSEANYAVYEYMTHELKDGDDYMWATTDAISDAILPVNNFGPVYRALLQLRNDNLIESENIAMGRNVKDMWRALPKR